MGCFLTHSVHYREAKTFQLNVAISLQSSADIIMCDVSSVACLSFVSEMREYCNKTFESKIMRFLSKSSSMLNGFAREV